MPRPASSLVRQPIKVAASMVDTSRWNTDLLKADFGQPICIVGTGFHDIVVPNVDLDTYLSNVQWYADLLSTVCDHIVWLSNTCPLTDEYRQTKVQTIEWNNAVRDLLKDYSDTKKISFIDVFEASVEYDHKDNIHMSPKWYELLGNMLLTVVRGGAMEPINDNSGSNTVSMKNR
jgi:hypothetical protein